MIPSVRRVARTQSSRSPYAGQRLLKCSQQIDQWIAQNQHETHVVRLFRTRIAGRPSAVWLGDFTPDVHETARKIADEARRTNSLYQVVLYNIPGRDAGSYSAGGAQSADAYRRWVDAAARGLNNAKGVVVLEPDALAQIDLLGEWRRNERYSLLKYAVISLESVGASVYIDAGHPRWLSVDVAADRLRQADVYSATGFALNVSNSVWTNECADYGRRICSIIGGNKGFVIDTSRNGTGPPQGVNGEALWCNPPSLRLGEDPTTNPPAGPKVHAYLWVKVRKAVYRRI